MVDNLKQVGTADWDRERLNMSINTPDSLSRVNMLRCLTQVGHGGGEHTVLVSGHVGGTVLSSKRRSLSAHDVCVPNGIVFHK